MAEDALNRSNVDTGTLLHLKGADPLAIKDQLRHTTIKTTENFYIGSDVEYQRSQIQRLSLNKEVPT